MPSPVSLSRFLIDQQWQEQAMPSDLRLLIEVVARAIKAISINVGKGALAGVLGEAGTGNVQGEAQKKLDVIANEILLEANEWGGHLAAMASEEMEGPHPIPHRYPKGEYLPWCSRSAPACTSSRSTARWAPSSSRRKTCASRRTRRSSRSTCRTSASGNHP
jgi:hypothetical protein